MIKAETPNYERDDQTQFSNEEPLFQSTTSPTTEGAQTPTQTGFLHSPQMKMILAIGGIIILLLLAVLIFVPRQAPRQVELQPSPSPSPELTMDEMQRRLDELEDDLEAADPTKLDLPVPPVRMDISIDVKRR